VHPTPPPTQSRRDFAWLARGFNPGGWGRRTQSGLSTPGDRGIAHDPLYRPRMVVAKTSSGESRHVRRKGSTFRATPIIGLRPIRRARVPALRPRGATGRTCRDALYLGRCARTGKAPPAVVLSLGAAWLLVARSFTAGRLCEPMVSNLGTLLRGTRGPSTSVGMTKGAVGMTVGEAVLSLGEAWPCEPLVSTWGMPPDRRYMRGQRRPRLTTGTGPAATTAAPRSRRPGFARRNRRRP
jgi:hypothetical protein